MKAIDVDLRVLPNGEGLPLPERQTSGSSGMDLYAAVDAAITIEPGRVALVPSGIAVALPQGFEFQVRPRSGLAAKHGLTVLNAPGTIDSDYRGEIGVILCNLGSKPFHVERGMRIAQMVLARYEVAEWNVVEELGETGRGDGGYGHTGRH